MNTVPPAQKSSRVVFLTGANGFVGSHLAAALLAQGHRVRALVRRNADRSRVRDLDIAWIEGDLNDHAALRRGCEGASWVIHCAGRVKAPDPESYMHANCTGTANLLEAVRESSPKLERFVYVSSLAAGGPARDGRPRTEDDPDAPLTPYGKSKLAGEQKVMETAGELPVVSVRPPAVYGPGDTEVLGFFQAVRWHIKPQFGRRMQRVSLVHVGDLVRGILLACESPESVGHTFYIAEDRHYTLAELEDMIQAGLGTWALRVRIPRSVLLPIAWCARWAGTIAGFTPRLNPDKARDFLVTDWTCSTAKANRILRYRSQIPFERGARETAAWYRTNGWL
ncbi:MAG: NAD-dependent epimerase/dehydratase family protein [Candidatus Zixiibacteriota bacterium]